MRNGIPSSGNAMAQGFEARKNEELKENWCDGLPEPEWRGAETRGREKVEVTQLQRTDRKGAKMHSQRLYLKFCTGSRARVKACA